MAGKWGNRSDKGREKEGLGLGWGGFATYTAPLDPLLTASSVFIFFC